MQRLIQAALLAANMSLLSAGVIFTPEGPGVTFSTVANTVTEDFNTFGTGAFSASTPIGTYSSGGTIVSPDMYSGDGTKYISVGAQSGTTSYTLTFNSAQSFFGLLWNAGDDENSLTFKNGATTVATFTTATISAGLGSGYFGNSSSGFQGQDGNEPFVYLNFFGISGTTFTSVIFRNSGNGTGFETDNHAILGSAVPEPSTWGMLLAGSSALAIAAGRRKRRNF